MDYEQKPLKAVHENDLDSVLERFGKKQELDQGLLKCKFCNTHITRDSLYSILPEAGTFHFICEESECVQQLLSYLEDKKSTRTEK